MIQILLISDHPTVARITIEGQKNITLTYLDKRDALVQCHH